MSEKFSLICLRYLDWKVICEKVNVNLLKAVFHRFYLPICNCVLDQIIFCHSCKHIYKESLNVKLIKRKVYYLEVKTFLNCCLSVSGCYPLIISITFLNYKHCVSSRLHKNTQVLEEDRPEILTDFMSLFFFSIPSEKVRKCSHLFCRSLRQNS